MRKIVVSEGVTVDGIFDAETMGQWAAPYYSDERDEFVRKIVLVSDALLLGRTSYDLQAWYCLIRRKINTESRTTRTV